MTRIADGSDVPQDYSGSYKELAGGNVSLVINRTLVPRAEARTIYQGALTRYDEGHGTSRGSAHDISGRADEV